MIWKLFEKKRKADVSFLKVDMHNHLLPGIDDGLKNIDDTLRFIDELRNLGYQKLICTPHILSGVHDNSPETILPALEKVRKALAERQIEFPIEAAAEYMVDNHFEELLINKAPLLTLGNNHILIEMSYVAPSPNLKQVIFELNIQGYKPILAHPERYNYYHMDFAKYEDIKERGIYFQVNMLSLTGYYGKMVKKTAEKLIKKGMVEFIGTDMHHDNHLNATKHYLQQSHFYKTIEHLNLRNHTLL